jgi:hypothetical protein
MELFKALQGAALAVACAGLSPLVLAPAASAGTVSTTFTGIGEQQIFEVPDGVTSVEVTAVGATGGGGMFGGLGGVVTGIVPAAPGEPLYVEVGAEGCEGTCAKARPFNGGGAVLDGGAAGSGDGERLTPGASGGGASDVQTVPISDPAGLSSRVLVAGGGGGSGGGGQAGTGHGGNSEGAGDGNGFGASGGGGGTAAGGGTAGDSSRGEGERGSLGQGGDGYQGGGGGGGVYGGGSGASAYIIQPVYIEANATAGGGGSNLIPSGGRLEQNVLGLPPHVTISYVEPFVCTTATGHGVYKKVGERGRLRVGDNLLSTNLEAPQTLRVKYETGKVKFNLTKLEKASCTGAPGERDFQGEGRAQKNGEGGYMLSFSIYEKEGGFFFSSKLMKGATEVEASGGPLKKSTETIT